MTRQVTEKDLRRPEFSEGGPEDYEFREDGKLVRKDRFMRGMQDIAAILFGSRHQYEIDEVVNEVHRLRGLQVHEAIEDARAVYESEPIALQCLDYLEQVLKSKEKK
jgi:hypothetical protein